MISSYEQATECPRNYLFIDLTPTTPSDLRLRSNILSVSKLIVFVQSSAANIPAAAVVLQQIFGDDI